MKVDTDDETMSEAKSGSGGGFLPMTNVDGCRWLRKVIC